MCVRKHCKDVMGVHCSLLAVPSNNYTTKMTLMFLNPYNGNNYTFDSQQVFNL